jgi:hypothetical protein
MTAEPQETNWWTTLINSTKAPATPTDPQIEWDQRYPGGLLQQLIDVCGPQPQTKPSESTAESIK